MFKLFRRSLMTVLAATAAVAGSAACDGNKGGAGVRADAAADAGSQADVAPNRPEVALGAADTATTDVLDARPPEEVGTFELARIPADPKSTRKLLGGAARLVGYEFASCTHAAGATGDRWCALSRPTVDGTGAGPGADAGASKTTDLWVMNMTKAVTGVVPNCDGSSADCVRLTSNLWTGATIYGVSHPGAHRFEGDTLIFHADAAPGDKDPYEGAIWAWRAGWKSPRKLTGDRAVLCYGEHESTAVFCVDNAVVERDPNNPFNGPKLRAFDLIAGTLDDAATGPLPLVTHIENPTGAVVWRARFSKDGASFLYSVVPAPGMPEALFMVKTATIGQAPPVAVLPEAAEWELSHDGRKLYFLKGYDRSRGQAATGTLMLADFPSGGNLVELQTSVLWFELLGARGEVFSNVDKGVIFAYPGAGGAPTSVLLRDRSQPKMLHRFGSKAEVAQVANDTQHTLYFQDLRGANFPSAFVNHSDDSGSCVLTSDYRAETYGVHFSDSSKLAFWIEFGRNQSESEEGWYASPQTCGDKRKFGDFVGWYSVLGDDFVLFEGGDLDDSTRWLQYSSLRPTPTGMPSSPRVIQERPDGSVGILRVGASIWAIYGVASAAATAMDAADSGGLYLHGPLAHPTP